MLEEWRADKQPDVMKLADVFKKRDDLLCMKNVTFLLFQQEVFIFVDQNKTNLQTKTEIYQKVRCLYCNLQLDSPLIFSFYTD